MCGETGAQMLSSSSAPVDKVTNSTTWMSHLKYLLSIDLVTHVWIVLREAKRLVTFLINGTSTWVSMAFQLICFTLVLTPGWIRMLIFYICENHIIRNVEFGKGSLHRNILDLYLPSLPTCTNIDRSNNHGFLEKSSTGANSRKVPIIVFVSGGVWIIGNKLWSALVGRGFALMGYLVVVPDYRNFPQGDITDMCADIRQSLLWTIKNGGVYNGDINDITLAGQSAGAHLSLLTIFSLFEKRKLSLVYSNSSEDTGLSSLKTDIPKCDDDDNKQGDEVSTPLALTHAMHSPGSAPRVSQRRAKSSNDEKAGYCTLYTPGSSHNNNNNDDDVDDDDDDDDDDDGGGGGGGGDDDDDDSGGGGGGGGGGGDDDSGGGGGGGDDSGGGDDDDRELDSAIMSCVQHLLLLNGPYDLMQLTTHLHQRGLDHSILNWIFKDDLQRYSPTHRILKHGPSVVNGHHTPHSDIINLNKNHNNQALGSDSVWSAFPAVTLMSCADDKSIPQRQALDLYAALSALPCVSVHHVLYEDKNHTSLILEDPLAGDYSFFYDAHTYMKTRRRDKYGLLHLPSHAPSSTPNKAVSSCEDSKAIKLNEKNIRVKGRKAVLECAQPFVHPTLAYIAKQINPF